ncbi:MAG: hypothetical protein AAF918_16115 [Pseudomonadota bacterium]
MEPSDAIAAAALGLALLNSAVGLAYWAYTQRKVARATVRLADSTFGQTAAGRWQLSRLSLFVANTGNQDIVVLSHSLVYGDEKFNGENYEVVPNTLKKCAIALKPGEIGIVPIEELELYRASDGVKQQPLSSVLVLHSPLGAALHATALDELLSMDESKGEELQGSFKATVVTIDQVFLHASNNSSTKILNRHRSDAKVSAL